LKRPNILMIMADQCPAPALGAYGHRVVKTPNLDALAGRGVVFENAYCNNPLCAPSRASMCSGRLTWRIGAFDNGSEFPAMTPTFMHHLRRAGYRTILCGKMHFIGPDQLHGFEERLTTDIYPASFVWTPDWRKGVYANPGTSVVQLRDTGLCKWNLQLDYDEEVQFRAVAKLADLARHRKDDRPFFMCVSYTHPHDPWIITRKYWDLYDHDGIDMPAAPAVPMEEMHPFNQWLQVHHEVDKHPPTDEMIRTTRHAFYGMLTYLDEKIGALLEMLAHLDLSRDTAVIFAGDHGEMMGEHGMWFKRTFFEWSSRVPLIVSWPGRWPAGSRLSDVVSLVDLFPTILDIAGIQDVHQVAEDADGESILPLIEGKAVEWKDRALCEYYGEGVIHAARMLRQGRYKYIYVHKERPQLFDLEADPLEQNDLAGSPEVADVERKMHESVMKDWDPDAMEAAVMRSQQARHLINEAMSQGERTSWDFQPKFDDTKRYVRFKDAQETNILMRYPRKEEG